MTATGWIGDQGPDLPLTELLLRRRQQEPGDTLAVARARGDAADARAARDAAAAAVDPDERAANLVSRGYAPGQMSALAQQLADTTAELQAEHEKIDRGQRRAEHVSRDLAAGRVGGLEAARRMDGDFGDPARAQQLERRAASLRRQIAEASALVSPASAGPLDGVEAAASRAREILGEVARARAPKARPPFAGPGAGAEASRSTEHTGPGCWVCAEGRKRDAERAAAENTAWAPGEVITTGYEPGMAYR